jgi:MoaA/NifB/PqqE/SkfB family radical SAM enzyme
MKRPARVPLNRALLVFFLNALRVAFTNPVQAFSFIRTILWLGKAARARSVWKKRGVVVPPILIMSVTNKCNLKCKGCYAMSFQREGCGDDELDDETLGRIVREARELGVSFFVIAGGEPLMRPGFLRVAGEHPQAVFIVFTNGLLVDGGMIDTFRRARNIVPLISLEGARDETDGRRGEGTYEQLLTVMELMKKRGIFFGNSLTLTRGTFSAVTDERFIRGLVTAGSRFFLFIEYTPTVEGTEGWVPTPEQRANMAAVIKAYRRRYPALFVAVPWDEEEVGGCLSAGRGFVHVSANGELEPCPFAPFSDGNLKDLSLKEALGSEFLREIRRMPELARETGGGCVLWKERELVKTLLERTARANRHTAGNS